MVQNPGVTSTKSVMISTPFLGGLNTELAGLVDSTDFTKEELNMTIRADGSRSRRAGVDYEENFVFNNELLNISNQTLAFNCTEWLDINSPDESQTYLQVPYIVVQIGHQIIFYKNEGQPYSGKELNYKIDLRDYKLAGRTDREVASARCKFTSAYGCLFITSSAIKPVRIRSAQDEAEPYLDIRYPYCTVSCAAFQGKHQRMGSAAPQFIAYYEFYLDGALLEHYDVPLNGASYVPFPNSYTMAESFNSISETRRRGIVAEPSETAPGTWSQYNAGWPNWTPSDWITFKASSNMRGSRIRIKVFGWAYKSGRWVDHTNVYEAPFAGGSSTYTNSSDYELMIRDTSRGANDRISTDENPSQMSYAHLYNLLNQGWNVELLAQFYKNSSNSVRFFPGNNLAQQYLKDTKTGAFKPQDLINMTFGNTPAARGHFRLNFFNQDRNTVGNLYQNMQALIGRLNELGISVTLEDIRDKLGYTGTEEEIAEAQVPVVKPRRDYIADTCSYAGRIFYLCGDVLLYSQMISEDISKAGQCYTDADPTSEELSDVAETDGGLISLPDIGEGLKLVQLGEYLLVFGTKGNALITGTANNIFTATAYSAGSLGALPTQAPDSFISTELGLFYWGTTGIMYVGFGQNGLTTQDISTDRILLWYGKLTNTQQQWCKGVYSRSKKKLYWFYPSDDTKPRRLDMCLVYDITRGSFAPQQMAIGYTDEDTGDFVEADLPEIVSGVELKVPFKSIKEYPIITVPEGNEASLEVRVDGIEKDVDDFYKVKDEAYLSDYTDFEADSWETTWINPIFRCDISKFSDMEVGDSTDLFVLFNRMMPLIPKLSVSLRKASSTTYEVVYSDSPSTPMGPYSASDVLWFMYVTAESFHVYFGVASEAEIGGTGYTAQTLPDNFITLAKNKELDYYTFDESRMQVLTKGIGDFETGFSFAEIQNDSFTNRYGELPIQEAPVYYIKSHTKEIYKMGSNGILETAGDFVNETEDYLIFRVITSDINYWKFVVYEHDGVNYYASPRENPFDRVWPTHSPVFTKDENSNFILYGFCEGMHTDNYIKVVSLDGSTTFEVTTQDHVVPTEWAGYEYCAIKKDFDEVERLTYYVPNSSQTVLADYPIDTEEFTYESSILVCLDLANQKITFGDFRNNLLKDWTAGDWNGDGYNYTSYLISHPMNATQVSTFNARRINDYVHMKNMPYLLTYFIRTETGITTNGDFIYPSGCFGSVLWDWRTTDRYGKWSSPSPLYKISNKDKKRVYKPYKKTIFDQGYIINKTNIRGLGRAYQVKLESDDNKQFVLEGIVYDLKSDGRI